MTQFVYDLDGHLLVEADSSGDPIREYIWLNDMPVALVDSSGTPAIYYIQTDHLGRPQKMTDGSRNIVWDGVFDPFGKVTSISGAATNLLMFPGQYHDSESQLSQNWHRDYDPSIGRYAESDPIGLRGGINTYAYVEGNPVSRVDPKGLRSIPVPVPVPVPFPGIIENDPVRNWIKDRFNALHNAMNNTDEKVEESCQINPEQEKQCDKQYYEIDIPTCRGIARKRGDAAAHRCYASASERYGACLAGKPMPPLDTRNN